MRASPRRAARFIARCGSLAPYATVVWTIVGAAACTPHPTPLQDRLPPALAIRSDTPWVIGRIMRREAGVGDTVRLDVVGRPGSLSVGLASVIVVPTTALYRPDGQAARPSDLTLGRQVVVWARAPERPSMPPTRAADAVLVDEPPPPTTWAP